MDLVAFSNSNSLRVACYAIAAACCAAAFLGERSGARFAARAWLSGAVILVVLAIGRDLEFGPWLTQRGREIAYAHGWYPDRRPFQRRADVALLAVGVVAVGVAAAWHSRLRGYAPGLVLMISLVVYSAVRTVSYHDVDQLLYNHPWHGIRLNSILEASLTLSLAAVALRAAVRSRGRAPTSLLISTPTGPPA
jgi:hypothetical protein